eukprot:scaffold21547_cov111-Isochrysis_galbana.AAC.5
MGAWRRAHRVVVVVEARHAVDALLRVVDVGGEIARDRVSVLYKKGDTRDVRNYRPITLLQVDYKIYSKVLVKRMKTVLDGRGLAPVPPP